jgi:hypothetical protein
MAYADAARPEGSRIHTDIQRLRDMVDRVQSSKNRVMIHARALGYFQDVPTKLENAQIAKISTTLADVLTDLDRALDELSGSLNVFD